ncbi:hypothetical protein L484_001545 [Morus notabilis]|uniref:Uncharacterized protein n=1 Tax=Morus notabilis TaxID=981085 RepID=W9RDI5_9ROSA|nr:hypothetical protein L484_001545 [Morus notabilis]
MRQPWLPLSPYCRSCLLPARPKAALYPQSRSSYNNPHNKNDNPDDINIVGGEINGPEASIVDHSQCGDRSSEDSGEISTKKRPALKDRRGNGPRRRVCGTASEGGGREDLEAGYAAEVSPVVTVQGPREAGEVVAQVFAGKQTRAIREDERRAGMRNWLLGCFCARDERERREQIAEKEERREQREWGSP